MSNSGVIIPKKTGLICRDPCFSEAEKVQILASEKILEAGEICARWCDSQCRHLTSTDVKEWCAGGGAPEVSRQQEQVPAAYKQDPGKTNCTVKEPIQIGSGKSLDTGLSRPSASLAAHRA
ncbi:hypothetical protein XENOCAPTIV_003105 [Xenoophorus captivus]|uniref:Uncharacterized protein n=1 Tax=Xenoophorus captivus TaxID=1517983 RepID=A0ABV0R6J4_9TELE